MSQFSYTDIAPHKDLQTNMYKFVQDYIFSIHRQRQIFYGDLPNTEPPSEKKMNDDMIQWCDYLYLFMFNVSSMGATPCGYIADLRMLCLKTKYKIR